MRESNSIRRREVSGRAVEGAYIQGDTEFADDVHTARVYILDT